ncbi:MAG TPA: hypothetical protein VMU97_02920 [Candidatus Dormibacteraeota bacterium]|nr:hypothetical protein [Candidatus Dormibacteraeota bacterium]
MSDLSSPECVGELFNAYQEGYLAAVQDQTDRLFVDHEAERKSAESAATALAQIMKGRETAAWRAEQVAAPSTQDPLVTESIAWFARTAAWRRTAQRELKRGDEIKEPQAIRSRDRQQAKIAAEENDEPFYPHELRFDRYVAGKGKLISRAAAIEQDRYSSESEEDTSTFRRPLLTTSQSEAIHQDWNGHEAVVKKVVDATVAVEFAIHEENQERMSKAVLSTVRFEKAAFRDAERPATASRPANQAPILDVTELRQYRELKARRSHEFLNRRRDGYDEQTVGRAA